MGSGGQFCARGKGHKVLQEMGSREKCLSSSRGSLGVVSHLHPPPEMGLGIYHQLCCFISLSLEIKNIRQQNCIPKPLKDSAVSLETTRIEINRLGYILIFIFILWAARFSNVSSHQRWSNSVCCCYVYEACELCSAPSSRLEDVDGSIRYCSSCCWLQDLLTFSGEGRKTKPGSVPPWKVQL